MEIEGARVQVQLRGALFQEETWATRPVAVGDRVRVESTVEEPGRPPIVAIAEVLPRRNAFVRRASGETPRAQVLAANVDCVLVLASVGRPAFSSTFVDRVLCGASACEIEARLVLTKSDGSDAQLERAIRETYRKAGVETLSTSAKTGVGLDALRAILQGRTSVLMGLSGVGKSTLLNALVPGLDLAVGGISSKWSQGKHTTSAAELVAFPFGGAAIDSPGVRSFVPWGLHHGSLRHCFPDLAPFLGRCHYADCSHTHEPQCAMKEAVESGEIAATRVASYAAIHEELEPPPEQWSEGGRPLSPDETHPLDAEPEDEKE